MKRDLKYSYKKADLLANHRYEAPNVTKFFKASILLMKLVSSGKNVIFVDEFKINLRNTKFMKWSKVGQKDNWSPSKIILVWHLLLHLAAISFFSSKALKII